MALNGAQREDKEAASALVEQAKGAVAEDTAYIEESYLISPVDGRITEKFPHIGELVGTGAPIMNVADLTDKWGSFSVTEDKLPHFNVGKIIKAYVPGVDKEVEMKIYYIKDLGVYSAWKATKIVGQYDRKTFEIRARFVDSQVTVIPGMSLIIRE